MIKFRLVWLMAILFLTGTLAAQSMRPVQAEVHHFQTNNGQFYTTQLFQQHSIEDKQVLDFARESQGLILNQKKLANLLAERPEGLTLAFPYHGENIKVLMVRTEIVSDDFTATTSESNGQPVAYTHGLHYRGIVENNLESIVAFSFFNNDIMGMISTPELGNMVLGQLGERINPTGDQYILYEESKLSRTSGFQCHTSDDDAMQLPEGISERSVEEVLVNGCLRIHFEADFELYQNKGSNIPNTLNYMMGLFNQVKTLFANETISIMLSSTLIWTSDDQFNNTNSNTALSDFRIKRPTFTGDLAHLLSLGGQGIGGRAYLGGLCNTGWKYGYSNIWNWYSNVPTYSWSVECVTHEIGHNIGSQHTHWCGWPGGALDNCYAVEAGPSGTCSPGPAPTNGGTIMSYCYLGNTGVKFSNGFGTLPGNHIRSIVNTASCLAGNPVCVACNDQHESNNTIGTAKVLPINTNFNAKIATATDADWYKFSNSSSARNIKVELTNLPADYDLRLYLNASTTQLGISQQSGITNEKIIYNTQTWSSNFYIQVYGYWNSYNPNSCYTLRVSTKSTAWTSFDDDSEDRDATTIEVPVKFESAGFGMFPNPTSDQVTIEVPAEQETDAFVTVSDVAGRVIATQQRLLAKDTDHQFVFDLQSVQNGLYFVNVRCGDSNSTRTLTVQR